LAVFGLRSKLVVRSKTHKQHPSTKTKTTKLKQKWQCAEFKSNISRKAEA